jgi:replicative DNA helicase Mcm
MAISLSQEELVQQWENFFRDYYKDRIEETALAWPEERALVVDYKDIDLRDITLAEHVLENPVAAFVTAERALRMIDVPVEPRPRLRFRVTGLPESAQIPVRRLRAAHLGKLVAVVGLIKKVTEVRPKLEDAAFRCPLCGCVFRHPQRGELVLEEPEVCPEERGGCGRGARFKVLSEESEFIDHQKIEIQESPEGLKGGAQPERLSIYVEDDLVGQITPGDRVTLNIVMRSQPRRQGMLKLTEFAKVGDLVSIEHEQHDFDEVEIEPEDEERIIELAQNPHIYEVLRGSFSPTIFGLEKEKDALVLALFGGVEKSYPDGSRTRGDIHVLMIGDPGTGKCVTGDTRVPLAMGGVTEIKNLVEEAMKGETHEIDDGWWAPLRVPVLTMDPRGRIVPKYTSRAWKREAPKGLLRVRTTTGRVIEATPSHPLFMTDGVAIHPRKAGEIRVGDHIALPRRRPVVASSQDPLEDVSYVASRSRNAVRLVRPEHKDTDFWRFVGLVLGDGNVTYRPERQQWWVEFTNETPELNEVFQEQARRLGLNPGSAQKPGSPALHSWATGVEASSFLTELGLGGTAPTKKAPPALFRSPVACQVAFLSGLFDADAHFSRRGEIEFYTASHRLAMDVLELLDQLGVRSSVKQKSVKGYEQVYWRVVVAGQSAVELCRIIRPKHPGKVHAAAQIAQAAVNRNSNIDVVPVDPRFLKDLREGLGLSQSALGVPRSTVLGIERGEKRPTRRTFQRITDALAAAAQDAEGLDSRYLEALARMTALASSDLFWDRIVSIETIPPKESYVYDLEVPDTHNFIAGGIVNHNSQLLRYMSKLAPRSIYTSGKSASAAGLTAAAVKDDFGEGQWTLEAGALVLADQGIACIDELDKMSKEDQSAMHQAMEQQEISIAKAGIQATLKSRCAVVGGANPKMGRFDKFAPIHEQINMPPALLSRFDLIFSIKDEPRKEQDEKLASYILRNHRAGQVSMHRRNRPDGQYSAEEEKFLFEKITPDLEPEFLRKYVAYAKRNVYPVLDDDAIEIIKEYYVDLRNSQSEGLAFTARQLEAFVRLSEASARVRLSEVATIDDAKRAIGIVEYYLKGVGMDPESGTFDIDMIVTGTSHTQRDRMTSIIQIIRELSSESKYKVAEKEQIVEQAEAQGIDKDKAESALQQLKTKGQVYEPRAGHYRLT